MDPVDPADRITLQAARSQLAEQDPLIDVRQDDGRREVSVSLYGEVQKDVLGSLLESDYGVPVTFRESTPICLERLLGPVCVGARRPAPVVGDSLDTDRTGDHLVIRGRVPAVAVHPLQQRVPDLTNGEGLRTTRLDHFAPRVGTPPTRPRTDDDPTDRVNYLKITTRRIGRS